MGRYSGALTNVGYGRETVPGTPVAASFWVPDTDVDFDDHVDKKTNESRYGTIEKNINQHVMKQWAEGTMKGIVYRNSIGLLLASLYGQLGTVTTVETTARKHAYALLNSNGHLSLTIAKKEPNLDLRFALARLDSLKITCVVDNYINYEAKFMSKKSATASNTPAYASETEFIPKHVVFKTAATGVSNLTAATGLTNVRSVTVEIKKNLKDTQGLGSVDLEGLSNMDFEVTGQIEKYYDDTTFKDFVFNNTHRSMRLDLIDTDTIVGAITNPSLRFDMPEVSFSNYKKNEGDSDIVTETIDFTALRNFAGANTILSELVNDTAAY